MAVRTSLRKSRPFVMPLTRRFHSFLLPLITASTRFVPRVAAQVRGFPSTSRRKMISLFRAELLNKKCLPSYRRPAAVGLLNYERDP